MPAPNSPNICEGCSKISAFLADLTRNASDLEVAFWIDMLLKSMDRQRMFLLSRRDQTILLRVSQGRTKEPGFEIIEGGPYKYTVVRKDKD